MVGKDYVTNVFYKKIMMHNNLETLGKQCDNTGYYFLLVEKFSFLSWTTYYYVLS